MIYTKKSAGRLLVAVALLAALITAGCDSNTSGNSPLLDFGLSKDKEDVSVFFAGGDALPEDIMTLTVSNTGRERLTGINFTLEPVDYNRLHPHFEDRWAFQAVYDGSLGAGGLSLASGESARIKVKPLLTMGDYLEGESWQFLVRVWNARVAVEVPVSVETFALEETGIDLGKLLRTGDTALVTTADSDKTAGQPWFSSNTDIARFDGNTLIVNGAGAVTIGFVLREDPLVVRGRRFTMYPELQTLNPVYSTTSTLVRAAGGSAPPVNLFEIREAAAGVNGRIEFSHSGGADVITGIDAEIGTLDFSPSASGASEVTVNMNIHIEEGEYSLHYATGTSTFTAQIGAAPAVELLSARAVNYVDHTFADEVELLFSDAVSDITGFTVSNEDGPYAIASKSVSGSRTVFKLDEDAANIMYGDVVTLSYNGQGAVPMPAFTREIANTTVEDTAEPYIRRAEVVTDRPDTIKVTFSKAVSLDTSNLGALTVKVNESAQAGMNAPMFNDGTPTLDYSKGADRTVTAAVPLRDGGKKYATEWHLTVNQNIEYAQIVRLAINTQAVAVDKKQENLIGTDYPLKEFIVKNLIPRQRGAFESAPGLYDNGVPVALSGNGSAVFSEAIAWIAANRQDGRTYTVVLGEDQSAAGTSAFTDAQLPVTGSGASATPMYRITIVLVSADASEKKIVITGTNGSGLYVCNGLTLIIDRNVAMEHENGGNRALPGSGGPLIWIGNAGRLILDGGSLRKNWDNSAYGAGAVKMEPGANADSGEAIFIMNGGVISDCVRMGTADHGAEGIVSLTIRSAFVMHGGQIINNTVAANPTAGNASINYFHGGAIAGFGSARQETNILRSNQHSLFMTGGSISGNTLEGPAHLILSSGGIMIHGSFQKTGGTIDRNTNTAGGVARRQIAVQYGMDGAAAQSTSSARMNHWYRDSAVTEDETLIVLNTRGTSAASSNIATTKPDVVPDLWNK